MSRSPSELWISQPVISDTLCVVYAPDWIPYWPFCHRKEGPTDSTVTTLTRKAQHTALPEQGASRFNFRLCPNGGTRRLDISDVYLSLTSTGTNSGESAASWRRWGDMHDLAAPPAYNFVFCSPRGDHTPTTVSERLNHHNCSILSKSKPEGPTLAWIFPALAAHLWRLCLRR